MPTATTTPLPRTTPTRPSAKTPSLPIRVAWQHPILPNYRVPYLEKLKERSGIEVTSFHGQAYEGYTTKSVGLVPTVDNVRVKNFFWAFGRGRIFWQSAVKQILRGNYDVIVCEEVVHNLSVWALWLFMRLRHKPFVLHGFGYRPPSGMAYHRKATPSLTQRYIDRLRFFMIRHASAIAVYTEKGKQACVQQGISAEKVFVMKNTYDTQSLMALSDQVAQSDLDQLIERYRLRDQFVLIFVGRLNPLKRVSLLLDVMRRLDARGRPVSLLIVGEGAEQTSLVERAHGLAQVHFLGGVYDTMALAKLFTVSNLLIIPGLPGLTCIHGFCYGVPILTTAPLNPDWPECPELDYIRHKHNGYFVDRPVASLFEQAIDELAENTTLRTAMGARALETAKTLTIENTVEQFHNAVQFAVRETRSTV